MADTSANLFIFVGCQCWHNIEGKVGETTSTINLHAFTLITFVYNISRSLYLPSETNGWKVCCCYNRNATDVKKKSKRAIKELPKWMEKIFELMWRYKNSCIFPWPSHIFSMEWRTRGHFSMTFRKKNTVIYFNRWTKKLVKTTCFIFRPTLIINRADILLQRNL